MSALADYVVQHTERGACQCGKCFDAPDDPAAHQPGGHTADLYFFQVAKRGEPDAERFRELLREHRGVFCECDPTDGQEHGYMELGGWIGDQGLAMQMMGLGALLGVWRLITPKLLPLPKEIQDQLAGAGMVVVVTVPEPSHA